MGLNPELSAAKVFSGAMALAVALAWNEAVKSIINRYYPADKSGGHVAMVIYAIVMTIVVLFVVWAVNVGQKVTSTISENMVRKKPIIANIRAGHTSY